MASLKHCGFEDIKVIGRGQYGKAHLVRSDKDQLFYIAKTIELTCLSKKERETATQEVDLLRSLNHPCIVQYKDNFFMSDTLVIIMEYCEGGDLQTYIKERHKEKQRIREVQIMNYFVQVLQALQYIHEKRILHRDLKTSNLFLMKSMKVVKLGDFGISRVLEGSIEAAITVVGTPYYMSPEVCENKPYTFKSDVWSFGCVLYELCMLKHAFSADNLLGLVYKIVSDKYEPIPKMYSSSLNVLIQRMLEKDADKRPSIPDLLGDQYVHNFMSDYVRTRGQCATPSVPGASSSTRASGGAGGGGQAKGSISSAAGATASSTGGPSAFGAASQGSQGAPPGSAASGARGAGARSPGGEVGAPPGSGGNGSVPGRPRATRREDRASPGTVKPTSSLTGAGGGAPGGAGAGGGGGGASAPRGAGHRRAQETPKEAALRRKREAADRQAAQLKAAAKQAEQNKLKARQMKETEFQSTRLGPSAMTQAAQAANARAAQQNASPQSPAADSSQAFGRYSDGEDYDDDSGSYTPEEELESPVEEISEEDYSDEYEDDFASEDESEVGGDRASDVEEALAPHFAAAGTDYRAASVNREEQDLYRVMANYEQDISRTRVGHSPSRRSPVASSASPAAAAAAAAPAAAPSSPALPAASAGTPSGASGGGGAIKPAGQVLDMKSRAEKLKEDLVAKMGAETFQKSFDYLSQARSKNLDERTVKKELEALVGRDVYKRHCFDVDQLVFSSIYT